MGLSPKVSNRGDENAKLASRLTALLMVLSVLLFAHPAFESKIGTFTLALYDEVKKHGWVVVSVKDDWKRLFTFKE